MIAGAVACGRKEVAATDGSEVCGMTNWIAENEIVIMAGAPTGRRLNVR
jgi:hypothetical protein